MSGTANDYTTVVVGCGLVGICTITTALTMVKIVYAIDSIPERLAEAEKIGAKTIALNENPVTKIKEATGGGCADVVTEVIRHADTLQLSIDLILSFGQISAVAVHTERLNLNGSKPRAYSIFTSSWQDEP